MAVQAQLLAYLLEQLEGLGGVRSRRMFGGVGLYCGDVFFGLIDDDTLFFKTGDSNVALFRERGMPRFMPFPGRPDTALGYHQVPADVIEDPEALVEWARRSVAVGVAAGAANRKRRAQRPPGTGARGTAPRGKRASR